MDCASAEMCKYAANAMLATRISFMNEIANVCELYGADVDQVRRAMGTDRRIGQAFLFSGIGYGGSCFPKDVQAMAKFSADKKYKFRILNAVEEVNKTQKSRLLKKLDKRVGRPGKSGKAAKSLAGRTVAVWGLAFKPRTDDMREAPAVPIIEGLLARGAKVQAYDPEAMKVAKGIFGTKITYARNAYAAVKGADVLLIVTEWNEFREPDLAKMRSLMKGDLILDGRNIYQPSTVRAAGFIYDSIGRP
jgi:UDPglucose 6-dehydrogenase